METHPHVFTPSRQWGCQGFSAKTEEQCGNHWIQNPYCPYHGKQRGKCFAIMRNGSRCPKIVDPAGREYFCADHCAWATPHEDVCQGKKLDGSKCYRRVIDGYDFCEWQHDRRVEYYSPTTLRLASRNDPPVTDQDRYNRGRCLLDGEINQVDHVDELQRMAFAFSFVTFDDSEDKNDVITFARDELMNKQFNLCRTLKSTNGKKGAAVTSFLGDVMIYSVTSFGGADLRAVKEIHNAALGVPIVTTYTDHLKAQGLGRDSTRLITREMEKAMSKIVHELLDQGETPIYQDLAFASAAIGRAMGLSILRGRQLD